MKKLIVIMLLICFSVGLFSQVTFTRKLISEERLDISTVSDFDQDGDLDIIQSYSMWMKNDGFGNFTEKELISLPDYKKHIIIDMNRDGYMDVISKPYGENYLLDTIFWYQNDGIFNFNEHMILSKIGDTGFTDAEATDLDGDGDIDVVTAGFGKDRLFWHGNDGFNNFASNIILECDTTLSYYEYSGIGGISCKDINKDGNIDIIYYTMRYVEDAKLSWLENTGNGNFVDHFIGFLSQDETKYFLKCTDINNSGDIDIIMLGWNESNFSIYENDGAGNFLVSNIQSDISRLNSIDTADFNQDGFIDLSASSEYPGSVVWYENTGDDNFITSEIDTLYRSQFSVPADFDNNRYPDILATGGSGTIIFYNNVSNGNTVSNEHNHANCVHSNDFNDDGKVDIVSASSGSDEIVWHENDGAGNFIDHIITNSADSVVSVFSSDIDSDGNIDIAYASFNDNKVGFYKNDGFGNLTEQNISTGTSGASSVYAGDIDSDGDTDLVSASFLNDRIEWHKNEGSYFTSYLISANADGANCVVIADVNSDGNNDVISASSLDDKISWYQNDGTQNFTEHIITTSTDSVQCIKAIDIDGDFDIDIVSASFKDGKISWFENDGNENFTEHIISTNVPGATSVYAEDTDYDGDIDILAGSFFNNELKVFKNEGSQNFISKTLSYSAGGIKSICTADIDGDKDNDFISALSLANKVVWYENKAPAKSDFLADNLIGYTPQTVSFTNKSSGSRISYLWDFGDGFTSTEENPVHIYTQTDSFTVSLKVTGKEGEDTNVKSNYIITGVGYFTPNTITTSADYAYSVYAIDMDKDGDNDVLSASYNDDKVIWYENNGTGIFTAHTISTTANGAQSVFAIDVDGDDDIDVLSASYLDNKIAWYRNDGNMNFSAQIISTSDTGASSVFAVDIDGDGDVDVISGAAGINQVGLYVNDGEENFTKIIVTSNASSVRCVYASDLDKDGHIDILSASMNDDKIAWYKNDGSNSFTEHVISSTADGAFCVFAIDVDGDGDSDVLSASANDDKIAWYENDGNQNFIERIISSSSDGARSVYAADFNQDGDIDIVSGSATDSKVAIYENDGSQNFSINLLASGGQLKAVRSVYAADLDNDRDLDVISASSDDDKISWFENHLKPTALFEVDTNSGHSPLNVLFTDNSRGGKTSWFWDFGDGYTSTEENPSHTYTDVDTFSVSLTVLGKDGSDTKTLENYIIVSADPSIPKNISIKFESSGVKIFWDAVPGALNYRIYGSDEPYGSFINLSRQGTFLNSTTWFYPYLSNKKFFYVTSYIAKESEEPAEKLLESIKKEK